MNGAVGMTKMGSAVATLVLLVLSLVVSQALAESPHSKWFQVGLATGETSGFHWSTGAKGLKGQRLSRICTEISVVEPPRNGTDVGEGRDATDCGEVKMTSDSVITTESLGPKKAGVTVVEAIYRPLVRKVTIVFADGKRTTLRAQSPNQNGRGIPMFRYVVTSFSTGGCVDRIVAFDGKSSVVSRQISPPC